MTARSTDSPPLQEFAAALGARDPKTVAAYLAIVRDFVAWLATQPGGTPFHLGLVTETAGAPSRAERQTGGLVDREGGTRVILDSDGTPEAAPQGLLPLPS